MSDLFNPLAPRITVRGGRLLGAFRMRHEKHTQSSNIPEALTPSDNAVAAAEPMTEPLNSLLCSNSDLLLTTPYLNYSSKVWGHQKQFMFSKETYT